MPDPIVLARTSRARSTTWWGRALVRSFEELAPNADDLTAARALAGSGRIGAIVVLATMASAVVDPGTEQPLMAQVRMRGLGDAGWSAFAREAAGESGHVAALEAGDLPADLVEHADEAGTEVLPDPADIDTACECDGWARPCVHALALLYQLGRHIDDDPYVLLLLRGRTREDLLAEVDSLVDARARAVHILALAEDAPSGHGLADAGVATYDEAVSRLLPPG